jgi:hypothetical protein
MLCFRLCVVLCGLQVTFDLVSTTSDSAALATTAVAGLDDATFVADVQTDVPTIQSVTTPVREVQRHSLRVLEHHSLARSFLPNSISLCIRMANAP